MNEEIKRLGRLVSSKKATIQKLSNQIHKTNVKNDRKDKMDSINQNRKKNKIILHSNEEEEEEEENDDPYLEIKKFSLKLLKKI